MSIVMAWRLVVLHMRNPFVGYVASQRYGLSSLCLDQSGTFRQSANSYPKIAVFHVLHDALQDDKTLLLGVIIIGAVEVNTSVTPLFPLYRSSLFFFFHLSFSSSRNSRGEDTPKTKKKRKNSLVDLPCVVDSEWFGASVLHPV